MRRVKGTVVNVTLQLHKLAGLGPTRGARRRVGLAMVALLGAAVQSPLAWADDGLRSDAVDTVERPVPGSHVSDSAVLNLAPAVCGVVALQWERRLPAGLSIIVEAGAGKGSSLSGFADLGFYQVGAQARYYVFGDFGHGLAVALDAQASMLSGEGAAGRRGLGYGPRVVYKRAWSSGLTVDLQVGMGWVEQRAEMVGSAAPVSRSNMRPIQAIGLGYSF